MYDKETGLYYLRNRYMNPKTGRFTSEDPARSGLNWYTYTSNNPIRFVDPKGLAARPSLEEFIRSSRSSETQSNSSRSGGRSDFDVGGIQKEIARQYFNNYFKNYYESFTSFMDYVGNSISTTISQTWDATKTVGSNITASYTAINDSISFTAGAGAGIGLEAKAGVASIAIVAKIDTVGAQLTSQGLQTLAVQEASLGYSLFHLERKEQLAAEKTSIFLPGNDFYSWSLDDEWVDTSGTSNSFTLGGGAYLGLGGSVEAKIDFNSIFQKLIGIWG